MNASGGHPRDGPERLVVFPRFQGLYLSGRTGAVIVAVPQLCLMGVVTNQPEGDDQKFNEHS